jgi:tetratricopeptide (TPR) repeat protein
VAAVDRHVAQLLRLKPRSQEEFEARIIQALAHRDIASVRRIAAATPPDEVRARISISTIIAASVPNPSAIAHLLNALPAAPGDLWQTEWRSVMLAQAAAAGGRYAEAEAHLDDVARVNPARALELRSMYAVLPLRRVPAARLRALRSDVAALSAQYTDSLKGPVAALVPNLLLAEALLDIRLGENAEALKIADRLVALSSSPNENVARSSRRWAMVVRAEESAARQNWGHALFATQAWRVEPNDGYPDLDHWGVAFLHFIHAEAQFQVRTYRPALTSFESIPDHTGYDIPFVAIAHLRQAQTHEERDPELARKHYKLVQEIWANADDELKPQLDFVRARLNALR